MMVRNLGEHGCQCEVSRVYLLGKRERRDFPCQQSRGAEPPQRSGDTPSAADELSEFLLSVRWFLPCSELATARDHLLCCTPELNVGQANTFVIVGCPHGTQM